MTNATSPELKKALEQIASYDATTPLATANRIIAEQAEVIAKMSEVLRTCQCPRPANAVPVDVDLTVEQCMARDECGCDLGTALALVEQRK